MFLCKMPFMSWNGSFFSQYFCFRRMFYFWKSFLCKGLKKMIVALEHAKRYDFSSYVQSRNGVRSQLTALHCLFFFQILMYLFVIVYRSNLCSMHSECTAHNFVMPASSLNGAKWDEKKRRKTTHHMLCWNLFKLILPLATNDSIYWMSHFRCRTVIAFPNLIKHAK